MSAFQAFLRKLTGKTDAPLPATSAYASRPDAEGRRVYHEMFMYPPAVEGGPWSWSARVYGGEQPAESSGSAPNQLEAKRAAIAWCEQVKKELLKWH